MLAPMVFSDEARLVLTSLADGPKHGYAIAQDVESFSGRRLGPGTLYGTIARLESAGYIEALAGDARRRPYRLTAAGTRILKDDVGALRRLTSTATRRLGA
jgi:DNA-binding PadR family transcriptional regulator